MSRAGFRFQSSNNSAGHFENHQGFHTDQSNRLGFGLGSNERNERDSILGTAPAGYSGSSKVNEIFSSSGVGGRFGRGIPGEPDSFSERCSSIDGDRLPEEAEENFKIGRGGVADSDEDVRLFRDIEIRLKIEPLSLKLL